MKLFQLLLVLTLFFGISNCSNPAPTSEADPTGVGEVQDTYAQFPKTLQTALNAHGGVDRWNRMQQFIFEIQRQDQPEKHIIDLKSRRVRLEHPEYTLGFDGQEVWVAPNLEAFGKGSPRFYHNLIFYFVAMPFVLADPGINYVEEDRVFNDKTYHTVSVSYNDGVGDAPEDEYIAFFDPETHQMEWLLYTVTYFTGEKGKKFNALNYAEWKEVNGLLVPTLMKGYTFEEDQLGDLRYERPISKISLSEEILDDSYFRQPQISEIDSLIVYE